jgi:hypothetical protein
LDFFVTFPFPPLYFILFSYGESSSPTNVCPNWESHLLCTHKYVSSGYGFDLYCDVLRHGRLRCLQVILTPTCRVSGYARQVIEVDASWTTTVYLAALTTVTTLITNIPLGTYNSSSWYIFLWDDATPLVHLSSLMTPVCLSLLLTKLLCWTASLLETATRSVTVN